MRGGKPALLALVFVALSISTLVATKKYAQTRGKECDFCHLDPSGGGELSAAGEGYVLRKEVNG